VATNVVASTSKFHIYSSFTLSGDDVSALSLLYAPLIGNDAFALYMGLASLLERENLKSEEIIHQDLFDIYSLTPMDFMKSRIKL
jgi:replication initiation and membrane attachment protein